MGSAQVMLGAKWTCRSTFALRQTFASGQDEETQTLVKEAAKYSLTTEPPEAPAVGGRPNPGLIIIYCCKSPSLFIVVKIDLKDTDTWCCVKFYIEFHC